MTLELGTISSWAAFGISLLAFFRPNLDKFYQNKFKPTIIDIYETGLIDIGFNGFGPTVHITGSLHCKNADTYIKDIRIKMIRKKDKSEHTFNWLTFMSNHAFIEQATYEIPNGFTIKSSESRSHNVIFNDKQTLEEIKGILSNLNATFYEYLKKNNFEFTQENLPDTYEEFSNEIEVFNVQKNIQQLFYWHQGDYQCELIFETDKSKIFTKIYTFSLDDSQSDLLRLNYLELCRQGCGVAARWNYHISSVEYKEVTV